jgi:hypothetical protein
MQRQARCNEQVHIMKHLNQILLVSVVTGLTGFGTTALAADASQYSSKAALFGRRAEPAWVAKPEVAKAAPPVTVASSKPWLKPTPAAADRAVRTAEPQALLADSYNSKKAARGGHEPAPPVFQIAPLK